MDRAYEGDETRQLALWFIPWYRRRGVPTAQSPKDPPGLAVDGGEVTDTAYGVDDMLPGVPTSGFFFPVVTSRGSVTATGAGTTIALNNGGYFELSDGTRYTCTSADGCVVANGTVTRGTVAGRAAGTGEVDRFPTFRGASSPGAQTYSVDTAIDALTLPEASGGNGTLPEHAGDTFEGIEDEFGAGGRWEAVGRARGDVEAPGEGAASREHRLRRAGSAGGPAAQLSGATGRAMR